MDKAVAMNNNLLIKEILEKLIQIENKLAYIEKYIASKKAKEDARWFF